MKSDSKPKAISASNVNPYEADVQKARIVVPPLQRPSWLVPTLIASAAAAYFGWRSVGGYPPSTTILIFGQVSNLLFVSLLVVSAVKHWLPRLSLILLIPGLIPLAFFGFLLIRELLGIELID